jgi:hypothetical protein
MRARVARWHLRRVMLVRKMSHEWVRCHWQRWRKKCGLRARVGGARHMARMSGCGSGGGARHAGASGALASTGGCACA